MNTNSDRTGKITGTVGGPGVPLRRIAGEGSAALELPVTGHVERIKDLSRAFLELVKIKITFFVGMSALFGYVLAANDISFRMLMATLGIFLVACGSAVLNHYQERLTDGLMHRTMRRPLPSGIVSSRAALTVLIALTVVGSAVTYVWGNAPALVLALLALVWYNGIYTPLKKKTAFAVIPGSFVGSLPIMAGWAAAGGSILDPRLIALSLYFFVWQIPHFWLLMDIYTADYERAGFPTLKRIMSERTFAVTTYAWTVSLVLLSGLFLTTGVVRGTGAAGIVVGLGIWLALSTVGIVRDHGNKKVYKAAFMKINVYVLAVTVVILVAALLNLISPWRF